MADVRSRYLVLGVGLIVLGYAMLVFALTEQTQRAATAAAVRAPLGETSTAMAPDPSPALPTPPIPTPSPQLSAATSAPSSAPSETAEGADVRLFKFSPGGATMSRDEVQRLMALGKALARRPAIKVSIEGFGDAPGSTQLMMGIAKHRAKAAQYLLAKSGVTEDRVSLSVADMGSETKLAGSIRLTTTPPLLDPEKP